MGDVIAGRFELLDVIASGASGTVWRAADLRHGRVCAAKVMRQRDSTDIIRFARENSVRIDHPHLLAPYAFAVEDDYVVIGMPLLRGGTVADLLHEQGALVDAATALLLSQLLEALATLHERGWIHRDVKPGNLLLAATGTGTPSLGLSDFGIAVHEDHSRLTATGFVNGTPGFVAPEVEQGGKISPRQDLWAAGVVALRCLDPSVVVDARGSSGSEVRAVLARLDPRLAGAIAALLEPDPARRGPDARTVAAALPDPSGSDGTAPYRTRDGRVLEVPDRMPPLPISSRWRDTEELAPGDPELTATPVLGVPRSSSPPPDDDPTRPSGPRTPPTVPRRRRGGTVPLVLGSLGVLAALVLTVLAVLGPPAGDHGTADPALRPGSQCSYAEQNQKATTAHGARVVCTRVDDGGYRWIRG